MTCTKYGAYYMSYLIKNYRCIKIVPAIIELCANGNNRCSGIIKIYKILDIICTMSIIKTFMINGNYSTVKQCGPGNYVNQKNTGNIYTS